MEYIWKKFPEEIIKGDNITESGFNYEEEYEKRVYKKVWMDIAWYCGRNGRRIFVLAVVLAADGLMDVDIVVMQLCGGGQGTEKGKKCEGKVFSHRSCSLVVSY